LKTDKHGPHPKTTILFFVMPPANSAPLHLQNGPNSQNGSKKMFPISGQLFHFAIGEDRALTKALPLLLLNCWGENKRRSKMNSYQATAGQNGLDWSRIPHPEREFNFFPPSSGYESKSVCQLANGWVQRCCTSCKGGGIVFVEDVELTERDVLILGIRAGKENLLPRDFLQRLDKV
jgi:hypothetical protein